MLDDTVPALASLWQVEEIYLQLNFALQSGYHEAGAVKLILTHLS